MTPRFYLISGSARASPNHKPSEKDMNSVKVQRVEFENLGYAVLTVRLDLRDVSDDHLAEIDQLLVNALHDVVRLLPASKG